VSDKCLDGFQEGEGVNGAEVEDMRKLEVETRVGEEDDFRTASKERPVEPFVGEERAMVVSLKPGGLPVEDALECFVVNIEARPS